MRSTKKRYPAKRRLQFDPLENRALLSGLNIVVGTPGPPIFNYNDLLYNPASGIPGVPYKGPTDVSTGPVSLPAGTADPILYPIVASAPSTSSGSPAVNYVDGVFMSLLGRAPTQSDLTFWDGVASRHGDQAVYRAIADSPEHRAFVASGQAGLTTGTTGQTGTATGTTGTTIGSTGTSTGATGMTGADAFVTQTFESLLNRPPTQSDLTFWGGVASRRGDRAVYMAIANSLEHRVLVADGMIA